MSRCFRNPASTLSLLVTAFVLTPGPLHAQRVAVLDATRSGPFNVFDGSDVVAFRAATLGIVDELVPLGTLLELDVAAHDMVLLHNGFSRFTPLQPSLSDDEQQKLRAFVEEGGAAWLVVDSYGGSVVRSASSVLAPFDVRLAGLTDDVDLMIEDPDGHPLTRGQSHFTLHAPSWFADVGPCATSVVSLEPPGGSVLAVIEAGALAPGSGRVVLGSEASWIVDPVGLFQEHEVLFKNSIQWLTGDIESGAPAGACDAEWEPPVSAGTFGECRALGPNLNAPRYSHGASLTRDGLCFVFEAERPGVGQGGTDIFLATRAAVDAAFTLPVPLAGVNGPTHDTEPNISPDGLTLYFSVSDASSRLSPGDSGEIFVATRSSRDEPFGEPLPLDLPELPGGAAEAAPTEDGLSLIIEVRIAGDRDLYEVIRPSVDEPFGELRPLSELNTEDGFEGDPCVSADGLTLLFSRNQGALCWASRPSRTDADGVPVPFGAPRWIPGCVHGDGTGTFHQWEHGPFLTPDWPAAGSKLYFTRYSCATEGGECGGDALWEATWEPAATVPSVVFRRGDCNDDGAIDIADISCTLNWLFLGADAPGCAAAVDTNGDGGADISDGTYLLNHLFLGGNAPVAPYPECGPGTVATDAGTCEATPQACGG